MTADKDALLRDIRDELQENIEFEGRLASFSALIARITAALAEKDGSLPFSEGVQHILKDFPRCVEEKYLDMKKITLSDGREALIRLTVTCDEHELDWYEKDWQPLPPLPKEK